jgi:hypothetical protein
MVAAQAQTIAPPGPISSFFASLFTLGLFPLLSWPRRWSEVMDAEQQDLVALAAWWRRRASPVEGGRLALAVERLQPATGLMAIPQIVFWCMLVIFGIQVINRGPDFDYFNALTFGWSDHGRYMFRSIDDLHLHKLWVWALAVGYICHWLAIRRYTQAMRMLAKWTNRTAGPGVRPVARGMIDGGMSPMWIISAIVLCAMSAWWAIPMVLSGAAQRRYTMIRAGVRGALSDQVRIAMHTLPIVTVASKISSPPPIPTGPVTKARFCQTRGCGARMPSDANFCPRCGASASQWTV